MAHPRLPRLIVASGLICLVRCVSEFLVISSRVGDLNRVYFIVSGLDLGLALLSIAAGVGLGRDKAWAPWLALMVGGVVVSTSICVGVELGPDVLRGMRGSIAGRDILFLLPRLILYAVLVAFWPWAAHRIIGEAPVESRKARWLAFAGALVLGGAVWGAILLLER